MTADKQHLLRDSKVFCIAPWTHMHVLTTGEIFPCCMSAHQPENAIGHLRRGDTLESAWDSEKMRDLRGRMLNGKQSRLCERCYAMEGVGQRSWRTSENELMAHHFDVVQSTDERGRVEEIHLPYLDIRFSNVCNLRCRICTPKLSSSWYKDGLAMGAVAPSQPAIITATDDTETLWNQILALIPSLERVHFAGGEPLIMEEHYQILDELAERGLYDIKLSYNTNFSRLQYKSHDVVRLWNQFPNIYLQASLDGMGARGDYMRKGQNWEEVVRNRERTLRECPHIEFCLLPTVSIMNVLHMPDFYKNWVESGYIKPSGIQLNILFEPEHYNIRGLPSSFKQRVQEKYVDLMENYLSGLGDEGYRARDQFESVLRYMFEEDWDRLDEFRQYTKDLDVLRGERFKDVFPELADLVEPSPYLDLIHSGRSYDKFGRTRQALRDLDHVIEELSESESTLELRSTLARAYLERSSLRGKLGDTDDAEADFGRARELDPSLAPDRAKTEPATQEIPEPDASRFARRAQQKRLRRDWEGALGDLTRAVELSPTGALQHINASISAAQEGVLRLFPDQQTGVERDMFSALAFGYYLRGVAKRQLGDRHGAMADFSVALEGDPTFVFVDHAKHALNRLQHAE